jgi:hypothetical protein
LGVGVVVSSDRDEASHMLSAGTCGNCGLIEIAYC